MAEELVPYLVEKHYWIQFKRQEIWQLLSAPGGRGHQLKIMYLCRFYLDISRYRKDASLRTDRRLRMGRGLRTQAGCTLLWASARHVRLHFFVNTLTGKTLRVETRCIRHHSRRQGDDQRYGDDPRGPAT